MNTEITNITRTEPLPEEGMLFVRTDTIFEMMVKARLIAAGLIIVFLAMPQPSFGSTRILDLVINPDGSTHVSSEIAVESESLQVSLFGPSVDNFVAVDDSGARLPGAIAGDRVTFDSLPSPPIVTITYDVHDLVSKEGRTWTFSFDSPADYTLLMPENSVIVRMSVLPNNMEQVDERVKLELAAGPTQIDYVLVATPPADPATRTPPLDFATAGLILGPITAAAIGASIVLRKRRSPSPSPSSPPPTTQPAQTQDRTVAGPPDPETVFRLRPDMREDDKEIVRFIHKNNCQAFESDLRKKFLQPRTTMWRAVKRLERLGVVEIYKKDQQNMVKLRKELEGED